MNDLLITTLASLAMSTAAVIVTVLSTRRNLTTTKFIDTITSHRIKWIDTIRDEVTDIVTSIYFTLNQYKRDMENKAMEIQDNENDIEYLSKLKLPFEYSRTSSALGTETKIWSRSDFVKKLWLFKIRLNPNEDNETIGIIDYFIHFYTEIEDITPQDVIVAKEKVTTLISKIQILLKDEWEKVKRESNGKL